MRRILALVLLCALLTVGLPALAEQPFTFDAETGTITGYTGSDAVVQVPASIDGVPVRVLGKALFDQNQNLKEVTVPEGVTHILYNAFYFCENLERVTLPDSLQTIDKYAFFSCTKLPSLRLPPALAFVDDNAFAFCAALSEVTFTGAAPFIHKAAFTNGPEQRRFVVPVQEETAYRAALGAEVVPQGDVVLVPPSQEGLQFDAALGAVTGYTGTSADLSIPAAIDGVPVRSIAENAFYANKWIRRVALPEGLTTLEKRAFFASSLAVPKLPDTLVEIGEEALARTQLRSLTLPDSLTTIGPAAFLRTEFQEVRVPDGVTDLADQAFAECWRLEDLTLPAGLKRIGARAFEGCTSLEYIVFEGDTPPDIAADAFEECKNIKNVDILWTASRAHAEAFSQAFAGLGLPEGQLNVWRADPPDQPPYPRGTTMTFDDDTQLVASYQGDLDSMTMYWNFWKQDNSEDLPIKGLGPGVFENSSLRVFSVPHSNSFEEIGERAFAGSALESIYLFDSVKHIGKDAFRDCTQLKEITLPDTVERIDDGAFAGCTALTTVVFRGQTVHIGKGVFAGCTALESMVLPPDPVLQDDLGVPHDKLFAAKSTTPEQLTAIHQALGMPWYQDLLREGELSSFVPMPDSFVPAPAEDFEFDAATGTITAYKGQAPLVVVPREINGVTVSGIAYPGFSNLTVLTVLEGTQDNTSLKQVVLPETIRNIADSAFLNCTTLERVDCYGPVDLVGIRAFEQCESLREVVFYNGVKELGIYCFNLCESLNTVALGGRIEELAEGVFWGCGFEELVLDVPVIGNMAYTNCGNVTTIRVTPRVRSLGQGVFGGMTQLETVYFERPDPEIIAAGTPVFDPAATNLRVILPANATEEQQAGFAQRLKASMLPGDDMVVVDPSMPAADVSQQPAASQAGADTAQPAEASPAPAPEGAAAALTPAPATVQSPVEGAASIAYDITYRAVSAVSSGIPVDIDAVGVYEARFAEQGTVEITLGDVPLPPLPYLREGNQFVIDLSGQRLIFTPQEDGLQLDFYGTMLLTMKPVE